MLLDFKRVEKKYLLVKMNYVAADYKDYLVPFRELKNVKPSRLPPPLQDTMAAMTDSTM